MPDPDFAFATLPGFWQRYERTPGQLAYGAGAAAEAGAWQERLRATLAHLLGSLPPADGELDAQELSRSDEGDHERQLVVMQVAPGAYMPCYVLIPHTPPPHKTIIALHGHGAWGARSLVGAAAGPAERRFVSALNYDYALQLVRRGYMVFAPTLAGFGERMEAPPWREVHDPADAEVWVSSCRPLAVNALLMGETLLGWRVRDVMRLIDYILTRPESAPGRLGCVGLSGGGTVTLYTAALDERITCAVVSGYLNTFRASIMSIDHCLCNFVPGLARQAEMADYAGLIAPRPLFIEAGIADPIYPIAGTRAAFAHLSRIYADWGAGERLQSDFFAGGHQWHGAGVYDWLGRWL